jgi:penicillin-binding protein 1A
MDINQKIQELLREIQEIEKYTRELKKKKKIAKDELEDLNNRVFDLYTQLNHLQRNYSSKEQEPGESFDQNQEKNTEKAGISEKKKLEFQQETNSRNTLLTNKEFTGRLKDRLTEIIKTFIIPGFHQSWKYFNTKLSVARVLILIIVLLLALVTYTGFNIYQGNYGELPEKNILNNINQKLATEIYSRNGQLMGRYFLENRNSIHFENIPTDLIHALIATEDVRFFEHKGIDIKSVFRVIFRTILQRDESSGGGSTLTQQLAKNLYPRRGDGNIALIGSKVREMIIAKRLEDLYTKDQLLQMYLNTVPFGEFTFGVKNASQLYFSKLPSELSIDQSCTLIGMLKGTTYYNPHKYPERATQRRNVVLSQMVKYGYLETETVQNLKNKPLHVDYNPIDHNSGMAPYLREYLRPILKEWCESHSKPNGEPYNLYTDGLKIYTTIDGNLQNYAEKAVGKHMPGLQELLDAQISKNDIQDYQSIARKILSGIPAYKNESFWNRESSIYKKKSMEIFTWGGSKIVEISPFDSVMYYLTLLNTGFMAMDPQNGEILAWVGGNDHRFFKYDHVTSRRQVGSTFKPFVYACALNNGLNPCDYFPNDSIVFEDYNYWTPYNANLKYGGIYSLQEALVNSVNTISVQVMMESGIKPTIQLAKDMGLESDFPEVPSISLGTVTASVKEMAEAYSGFAGNGRSVRANALLRIENSNGEVLESFNIKSNSRKVLDEEIAEQITMMLQEVVERGTARSLSRNFRFKGNVAGKTGTTQDQADGWFVGYTPNLVFSCWVGAEYPAVHFDNLRHGQGAATALPVVGYFLDELYDNDPGSGYFGNFRYYRINPAEYSCTGYIEEENLDQVRGKVHYLRRMPGLAGYWFGTSDFGEIQEEVTLWDIDEDWGTEYHGHRDWAIAWKGAIEAPFSGEITFQSESSGRVLFMVDDERILSGRGKESGKIRMQKGKKYPVLIAHAQSGRGSYLRIYWQWQGKEKSIIPGEVLFHHSRDMLAVKREPGRD